MRVYLDNNATTAIAPPVLEHMTSLWQLGPMNPGSIHAGGRRARQLFEAAQKSVLDTLGLPGRRVIFCGSATEAVNLVLRGEARSKPLAVAHTSVEHPATVATAASIGQPAIATVARDGQLDLETWRTAVGKAGLAASMFANNETGGILPIAEMASAARAAGIRFMVDACQCPGKTDFLPALHEADPDYLVLSGQKIHGPVGVAALIVRDGASLPQQITGGGQQHGLRAGTEPVVLASGLALALQMAVEQFDATSLRAKLERIWHTILTVAPEAVMTIPAPDMRLAQTLHYRIPGVDAQRQIVAFDLAGVECSSASACESGAAEPSRVMLGMGYTRGEAMEGVRMAVSRFTTEGELDFACTQIADCLRRITRRSPAPTGAAQ